MKSFSKLSLALLFLTLFTCVLSVVETKAQGPMQEILKRMEANRNSLTSLRASVKMEKSNVQLGETDVSEGTTMYLPSKGRDALVRIDWTKPVQETLSVVNKKYVLYTPRRGQAITGNANQAKGNGKANNLFAFISMSKDELNSNFKVKYLGQENVVGGVPTWHLEMTPKNAAAYKFSSAEMWVDGNGMPLQIKVTEANKDTTTLLLYNLNKNATINASVFKVDLPKGTKIING